MDDLIEIRRDATKGYGVFAKKKTPSYTTIVKEAPILRVKSTPEDPAKADRNIETAFKKLSSNDQATVLNLHEGSHPTAKTRVTKIFHGNAFGDGDDDMLFLMTSRLNHSCLPNASVHINRGSVRVDKTIAPGEEICISYLPPFSESMTARQRGTVLQLHYGFKCHCEACWPELESWKSDVRRQLIGFLSHALKGERAPDFRPLDNLYGNTFDNWPPRPIPSGHVLTPAQEIEYNFLLANMREAEGLWYDAVAECYARTAMREPLQNWPCSRASTMRSL